MLFQRRSYGRRGEIVAARLNNGQMVIGQYYHHGRETEIRPANADFESLFFPADEVSVQGVMRALLRPFPLTDHSE
ncbi:MAG: hypothetical protein HOP17_16505 [Acidobacteria bacterium]|nr:hypothetical protein [Acidobacteriota bacterium]